MIKLSVSIFGQTKGYRIYTVSREPIQYFVFGISVINLNIPVYYSQFPLVTVTTVSFLQRWPELGVESV